MSREMLNVRVGEWLMSLIDEAAEAAGAQDRSAWVREALEAGARKEIAHRDRPPQRPRRIGGGFVATTGVCTHPPTAREQTLRAEVCGLCGAVTKRRT